MTSRSVTRPNESMYWAGFDVNVVVRVTSVVEVVLEMKL